MEPWTHLPLICDINTGSGSQAPGRGTDRSSPEGSPAHQGKSYNGHT